VIDEEGDDLPDHDAAEHHAIENVMDLMKDFERDWRRGSFEVTTIEDDTLSPSSSEKSPLSLLLQPEGWFFFLTVAGKAALSPVRQREPLGASIARERG
jgi:hypothetical protein